MHNRDFSSLTLTAIQAALKAGDILRRGFGTSYEITMKIGRQNFVTEFDKRSEDCIISYIKERFPSHSFLAEESGFLNRSQDKSEVIWVIDPLDGTSNFARHIPIFTISLAAMLGEKILCGVIFHPLTYELFVAERGKGAYLNGSRVAVSKIESLDDCVIVAGLSSDIHTVPFLDIEQLLQISRKGLTTRNFGSAALSLAYVAAGKVDALWMYNLYPWDLAAGQLLVEEAGGTLTRYYSEDQLWEAPTNVLASNGTLHQLLRDTLYYGNKDTD